MEVSWNLIVFFVIFFCSLLLSYFYRKSSVKNKNRWYWHYPERFCYFSGLTYLWRKFIPKEKDTPATGWIWLFGSVYIAVYAFTSLRYENKLDNINFIYNTFTTQIASGNKFSNKRLLDISNTETPVKPKIFEPHSVFKSLYVKCSPDSKKGYSENFFHSYGYNNVIEFQQEIIDQWKAKLEGADFHRAELNGIDFSDGELDKANFIKAKLEGANFFGAILVGANFWHAKLDGANFESANLDGVNFESANLDGANFERTKFNKANFNKAKLEGANFRRTKLDKANFIKAKLERANFFGAILVGANFWHAKLEGANFRYAELNRANFCYATCLTAEQLILASNIYDIKHCPEEVLEDIKKLGCDEMLKKRPDDWSDELKKRRKQLIKQWKKEEEEKSKQQPTS